MFRLPPSSHGIQVTTLHKLCELEALPVDDGRARLVVLLLGDPHLLECGQRGEDRASDPDGVPRQLDISFLTLKLSRLVSR